jgi:V/A-type H+/Na+-transporting ATPase subunit F
MTNYTTAIIGPHAIISGFSALGVVPFPAHTGSEMLAILKSIKRTLEDPESTDARYAVVILIESLVDQLPKEELDRVSRGALPALVILPGVEGSRGAGAFKLKRLAERAVGSNILG